MPFCLLFFGALFLVSGVRDQTDELNELLLGDFTGEGNFLYWLMAIIVVGSLGYVPRLKGLSDAFLVLIVIQLILQNGKGQTGGFFQKFRAALNTTATPTKGS